MEKIEDAKEFLKCILSDKRIDTRGVNIKTIIEIGGTKGFDKNLLKVARKELGVVSQKYKDGWFWRLF